MRAKEIGVVCTRAVQSASVDVQRVIVIGTACRRLGALRVTIAEFFHAAVTGAGTSSARHAPRS